jgi:hypothetical protein
MIRPRAVIVDLVRTATPEPSRRHYLKLDRNELVPPIDEVFRAIVDELRPDSFSAC